MGDGAVRAEDRGGASEAAAQAEGHGGAGKAAVQALLQQRGHREGGGDREVIRQRMDKGERMGSKEKKEWEGKRKIKEEKEKRKKKKILWTFHLSIHFKHLAEAVLPNVFPT